MRAGLSSRLLATLTALNLALGACGVAEFDLGIGAFEIGVNQAILWTHVVPDDPDRKSVAFTMQVATDPDFSNVVREQVVTAKAASDFTVRALVPGLKPATRYHYRFFAFDDGNNEIASPTGTFRTAPREQDGAPVRFVISGDSNLGYTGPRGLDFHVLSAAVEDDPDFFVYFGDTIYADSGILPGGSAFTLGEYRQVHRLTRGDPHLQALLAATGTFSGWDDHEVRNDYDGETVDPVQFENGAQAFFEYLPVRQNADGPPFRTDRSVRWGKHVELFFLDGRQFRSAERFCNPDPIPDGPETPDTLFSPFVEDEILAIEADPVIGPVAAALLLTPSDPDCVDTVLADPDRSILGARQLDDLKQALLDSTATFKIIVNNTPLSTLLVTPYDRWDGYLAEKADLLEFISANLDPSRVLVLTTDFHTNMAIRRSELTEVIVGPIGQTTFGGTVRGILTDLGLPPALAPVFLNLFDEVVALGNGGPDAVLASAHDAFSYARVEVWKEGGTPRLRLTARGNPDYLLGVNDPADVVDLFTIELP
ncbi:MAG: alkaline phosphatase D family protein [Deltaproteobacteria bacterium]|nr:MAG: alkaline phosphatase D family protein [Deltaproteobacteria bacterium]